MNGKSCGLKHNHVFNKPYHVPHILIYMLMYELGFQEHNENVRISAISCYLFQIPLSEVAPIISNNYKDNAP